MFKHRSDSKSGNPLSDRGFFSRSKISPDCMPLSSLSLLLPPFFSASPLSYCLLFPACTTVKIPNPLSQSMQYHHTFRLLSASYWFASIPAPSTSD